MTTRAQDVVIEALTDYHGASRVCPLPFGAVLACGWDVDEEVRCGPYYILRADCDPAAEVRALDSRVDDPLFWKRMDRAEPERVLA